MGKITAEDFLEHNISEFRILNREDIPIIAIVKVTDSLYANFDIIMNKHYNGDMQYLPLILDFNNINDMVEVSVGTILRLPDISYIEENLELMKNVYDSDALPGVLESMDNQQINKNNSSIYNKTSNKKTAQPKLKITLPKVSYDNETGTLKF